MDLELVYAVGRRRGDGRWTYAPRSEALSTLRKPKLWADSSAAERALTKMEAVFGPGWSVVTFRLVRVEMK